MEQSSAYTWDFYTYHESYTRGATRWLSTTTKFKLPEKETPSYFWTYHPSKKLVKFKRGKKNKDYFDLDALDFSKSQFNVHGLQKIKGNVPNGVDVYWLYLPCSVIYRSEVQHENHQNLFIEWAMEEK